MTAPLARALLYIGPAGDMLQARPGRQFALGIGMGILLLLLGPLWVTRFLPRPGAWMNRVKVVFGLVFLAARCCFIAASGTGASPT